MVNEFLQSLVIIFGASAVVVFLLHRVKVPNIVGFLISGVIIGPYGIALLTSRFGLSLSLGAFLAGIIISELKYADQATSDIVPFKENFVGPIIVSAGKRLGHLRLVHSWIEKNNLFYPRNSLLLHKILL
jgi:Kef-type K+ transport system membrane component KefB